MVILKSLLEIIITTQLFKYTKFNLLKYGIVFFILYKKFIKNDFNN
jgi:hypothetical protein